MRKKSIQQIGMPTERYGFAVLNYRIILAVFLLAALLFVGGATAATYSGTCGDNLTWTADTDTGVLEINGVGNMTDYSSNHPDWYPYRDNITTVYIGSGVTSIGDNAFVGENAFKGYPNLNSVFLPQSIKFIGDFAFAGCSNLTYIEIPYGVTSLVGTFSRCTSLTSIELPESITSIESFAFSGTALTSIVIPDGVTSIGYATFDDCSNLTYVYLPDSITSIEPFAFCRCTSLTSIDIPDNVTSIGEGAFEYCTNLTAIDIPDGITSIDGFVFQSCSSLTSIVVPEGVTSIGLQAFNDCSNLTYVALPDSLISIGEGAFGSCTSLPNLIIPDCVTSIGDHAFSGCSNLTYMEIPNGVTSLEGTFSICPNLRSVLIPDSVTSIGSCAFFSCSNLTYVVIPKSVAIIGTCAFQDCTSLTSVVIPDSVTHIDQSAFSGCSDLEVVYLRETIALTSVEIDAFGSNSLNAMKSGSVIYVSDENTAALFIDGTNYYAPNTTIVVNGTTPETYSGTCGENLTWTLNTDTGVLKIDGTGKMTDYNSGDPGWYQYRDNITAVTLSSGVTSIGGSAFSGCKSLTSIEIPDTVTSIGSYAFSHCTNLTSVIIPNGVASIKFATFDDCTSLTSVTIGNNVTSIENSAFFGCTNLTSVVIPGNVTTIGEWAFTSCTNLSSVVISESVTTIGTFTFAACTNLSSVTIGNGLKSIGDGAFVRCSNLEVVDLSRAKAIHSVHNAAFGNNNNNAMKSGSVIYVSDEHTVALFIDGTNYYAPNTTIVVKETTPVVPKFTIETSSPREILLGENITVSGIAEGTDSLRYYVLAPYYSSTGTLQVASDGSYTANFSTSRLRVDSPCFVVIQHPMYDAIFNVAPVHNELTNNYTCAYQNNTARPSGGTGDIFLFNMTNTTGMYAFEKICQGIDDPANDDLEVNVTFTVRKGDPTAGSLVYIYQNAALKSNTTYYQWVDGNPAGSVTTNFNGTLIGEGIAEGLYSSSSTSPADLFTLKYPMINLSAYLNNTSIPISGRNIPKNQTIDFNVSGNNGLYYALRFLSPDGNSTFTFGNTTFDSYNITKNPEMLNKVSLTNVTPGIWKVYAIFYDSPDSYNTLNTYTPSVYKCSEVIRFDVGTAEPWIFTAVPESPEVSKGNEIVITGTAENTGGTLRYYVFSDHYTIIKRIPVNNDGSYKVNFSTVNLSSGSCFVIIQHPMYDGIFNIGPVHNILTDNFLYIYQNNTAQPTGEDGDIFLVNISNTTGFPAFEIVRQGIDNPANDDRELNLTFRITGKTNDTTLPLNQGWNFISVPKTLNATKNTAGSLFGSVDTGGKNILAYNTQTKTWTSISDNKEIIQPLNGYWIYAAAGTDITLSYPSEPASTADKILYPGWNAVGYSADEQTTAETALACLNGSWKTVIPWNLAAGMYDPAIINGGTGTYSPERLMTFGNGYWVYVDSESTLKGCTA